MTGAGIDVLGLDHVYPGRSSTPDLTVLHGFEMHVAPGEHVAVVGPSGSGKTTVLSVLGGLEQPQRGSVQVGGHDLHALGARDLAAFRREVVGFVFQHFGLLDTLTAAENVELACTIAGVRRSQRRRRAAELLDSVGLNLRSTHLPSELSGGERQRVAIARALANDPPLLLADEPTGNLDGDNGRRVADLLISLNRERGCTLVVVTHDPALAARAARRVHLVDGAAA